MLLVALRMNLGAPWHAPRVLPLLSPVHRLVLPRFSWPWEHLRSPQSHHGSGAVPSPGGYSSLFTSTVGSPAAEHFPLPPRRAG